MSNTHDPHGKHQLSGDEEIREHSEESEEQCEECTAWIKVYTDSEGYTLDPECDFCEGNTVCDGHIRYLHGQLDQHGRERTENVDCEKMATIYDTEGHGFYCDQCWTIMCDGNPIEYEEFVKRRPA